MQSFYWSNQFKNSTCCHRTFFNCFLIMALFSKPIYSQHLPETIGNRTLFTRFQTILDSVYTQHPEVKGMSVYLVSSQHKCLWYGSVGKANSNKENLSVEHPVNIASVTKVFVAAAILKLVEQDTFSIETPIINLVSSETKQLLLNAGYDLNQIKIKHLLGNTSGIFDFVNTKEFQDKTIQDPKYIWTLQEQIALAANKGKKRFNPSEQFEYSETNYLILAEILSIAENQPYHLAVKNLLHFNTLNLASTWFIHQEKKPESLLPLAEQTAKTYQVNSLTLHPSFDAFGGGGLASTVHDMAQFGAYLFEGKIFNKPRTLALMCKPIEQKYGNFDYALGLAITNVNQHTAFGHGGFWGTQLKYIPDLKLSIGVYVLERDAWPVYNLLVEKLVEALEN